VVSARGKWWVPEASGECQRQVVSSGGNWWVPDVTGECQRWLVSARGKWWAPEVAGDHQRQQVSTGASGEHQRQQVSARGNRWALEASGERQRRQVSAGGYWWGSPSLTSGVFTLVCFLYRLLCFHHWYIVFCCLLLVAFCCRLLVAFMLPVNCYVFVTSWLLPFFVFPCCQFMVSPNIFF